jgi:hypothetical protein
MGEKYYGIINNDNIFPLAYVKVLGRIWLLLSVQYCTNPTWHRTQNFVRNVICRTD